MQSSDSRRVNPAEELKKVPAQEYYRFIVDGNLHSKEQGWLGYAEREPNSLPAAFKALQFALTNLEATQSTLDLIKSIHRCASTSVSSTLIPGKFRQYAGGYFLSTSQVDPFLSKEGFREFCQMIRDDEKFGSGLIEIEPAELQHMAFKTKNEKEFNQKENTLPRVKLSLKKLWMELEKKKCFFYRAPDAEHLDRLIQDSCDHYNKQINATNDPEKKLRIIALHVQRIERIHPFKDFNGRTSLILLQRLLIQNGFLPVMLQDPNYIDGYSTEELIQQIKQGMLNTQQMIRAEGPLFGYQTTIVKQRTYEPSFELPNFFESPHKIIYQFYQAQTKFSEFVQELVPHDLQLEDILPDNKESNEQAVLMALMNGDSEQLRYLILLDPSIMDKLIGLIMQYHQTAHETYDIARGPVGVFRLTPLTEERLQQAKSIKDCFIRALEISLPHLDETSRQELKQKLDDAEAVTDQNSSLFLKDHCKNRFYNRFTDTNSWKTVNNMLTQPEKTKLTYS